MEVGGVKLSETQKSPVDDETNIAQKSAMRFLMSITIIMIWQCAGLVSCRDTEISLPHTITAVDDFPFSLVVASDTQLPWYTRDRTCTGNDSPCVMEAGERTNLDYVKAMNAIETLATWPKAMGGGVRAPTQGVIINGDLTAYWHAWQVDLFREFYDVGYANARSDVLKWPLYPGLGNHDYANNVDDCWGDDVEDWFTTGANTCAIHAKEWLAHAVTGDALVAFPHEQLHSFDPASDAYSWDIGGWHFVQLNNYPTYSETRIGIAPSIAWLKQDLQAATKAGMKIVINMHDYGDHWDPADAEFVDALAGADVRAIFAGHLHDQWGHQKTTVGTLKIPLYRSGSAEYNHMLLAEFRPDGLSVGVVDTTGGVPKWEE